MKTLNQGSIFLVDMSFFFNIVVERDEMLYTLAISDALQMKKEVTYA